MKKILAGLGILGLLGIAGNAKAEPLLPPLEFTKAFVSYLQKRNNNLVAEVTGALEVNVKTPEKDFGTLFLSNIYALYNQNPDRRAELFEKYSASILEMKDNDESVSLDTLVAVVKDNKWAEDMDRTTMGPEGKGFHILTQPLNGELLIAYATDTPHSVSYQGREKILALEKSMEKIQQTGIENLKKAIGPYDFELLERGVYQAKSKTGDYDASIPLLPDSFAAFITKTGAHQLVFTIPARNILIVADAMNKDSVAYLKALTESVYKSDPYYVSPKLYTITDGKWDVYKE